MKFQVLVVDDQPEFAQRVRLHLETVPHVEVIALSENNPCRAALDYLDQQADRRAVYLLIDLHMQDLDKGHMSDRAGEAFVDVLAVRYPDPDWLREHVTLYSSYLDLDDAARARELGVARVSKLHLMEYLDTVLIPRIAAQREREHLYRDETLRRQRIRDRNVARKFYRDPAIRKDHGGKMIAVHRGEVLGVGDDLESALANAAKRVGCPDADRLLVISVPPWTPIEEWKLPLRLVDQEGVPRGA